MAFSIYEICSPFHDEIVQDIARHEVLSQSTFVVPLRSGARLIFIMCPPAHDDRDAPPVNWPDFLPKGQPSFDLAKEMDQLPDVPVFGSPNVLDGSVARALQAWAERVKVPLGLYQSDSFGGPDLDYAVLFGPEPIILIDDHEDPGPGLWRIDVLRRAVKREHSAVFPTLLEALGIPPADLALPIHERTFPWERYKWQR